MPVTTLTSPSSPDRGQQGQVIVVFALFLVVLLGFAALTVDYGSWLKIRRDYQNVADAMVLDGARFLSRPLSQPCIGPTPKAACAREAAWNAFQRMTGDTTGAPTFSGNILSYAAGPYRVTICSPAASADCASRYPGLASGLGTVFASVEASNPTYLSRLFGRNEQAISAWATASLRSGRFAVITLRKIGEAGPNDANDISISGTNSVLMVRDGDVGGNWGLAIGGSGARLSFASSTGDTYGAFLADPRESAPGCCSWTPSQVTGGSVEYMAEVPDPNYPLPWGITSGSLASPAGADPIPTGTLGGVVDVRSSGPGGGRAPGGSTVDAGGVRRCDPASPRIGPGYYTNITLEPDTCLVLDPTMRHSSLNTPDVPDAPTPVPASQYPGIFYVNGTITVGARAMLVGDGVTILIRPGSTSSTATKLDIKSNAVVAINLGATPGSAGAKPLGGWYWNALTQTGSSPYTFGTAWTYNAGLEADTDNRGIAIYVPRRNQYSTVAPDDNSNILNNIQAGAAMVWKGVIYAPHDNVTFAGQVGYDAVGQLVAWTVKFTGGTAVTQQYLGPEQGVPYLIEPKIGQ